MNSPSFSVRTGCCHRLQAILIGMLLTGQGMAAQDLLNIDFGVGTTSAKQGFAAIGNSATDFWNLHSRDYGSPSELRWADASTATVTLSVANAGGAWGNGSADPMFGVYLYPAYGENITVRLADLPAGTYDLYVYAHGALDGENGVVEVASGGDKRGPLSISTEPGWNTEAWQSGRQYVLFDSITVGSERDITITVLPGSINLAVLNGIQLLKKPQTPTTELINVDFGAHQNPAARQKTGLAAVGQTETDYWNLYSRDDGNGGFLSFGILENLITADGRVTDAGLTVADAPGFWIADHPDAMMDGYLYPLGQSEILVTVTNLPSGTYDLLFYAHGSLDAETGNISLSVDGVDLGTRITDVVLGWRNVSWQEGVHYVRFSGFPVSKGSELVIRALPGPAGLAVINGMQLLRNAGCSPAPAGQVAWWRGEGDGSDALGGHDGTLENGLGFADGIVGQAFAFSALGQHLLVPASPDFVTDSLTLETWINPDAARLGEQQPIFEFADESGPGGVHFWLSVLAGGGFESPGALFANIRSITGESYLLGTAPGLVAGDAWSHVALTYDSGSGQGTLYLNGELVAEANLGSIAPNTRQNLYLGYRPLGSADGGGGYTFGGKIDEPGFYRRALSAAEIAAIHAAGSAGKCLPAPEDCAPPAEGLLAWWPGEGSGWDELGRHAGEVTGAAYAAGVVGQGFLFDGEAARVRIPFEPGLSSTAYTVEAWVQPLGQVVDPLWGQDLIFGQALGNPALLVRPGTDGVTPVFGFTVNPFLTPEVISSVELPIGEFSHVAGSWDGTALRIYVNGVLTGETVPGQVPALSTCDYFIGGQLGNCAGYGFDGGFFQGLVDELSLYGRALSAFEIARIHAAGGHGKCALPGYALTVETSTGGSVLRDPEAAEYRPGQTVTLNAVAEPGFAFAYWEGAVTGTDPVVTVLMEEPKQVTAVFMDVAPPQIAIESPVPGVTELQSFVLSGQVTDNLGLGPVRWEYNGSPLGTLPLTEGRFLVEDLDLVLGENLIRIYALDVAGNEGMTEIVVEWVPARLLAVVDPEPRQEGSRVQVPIQLTSNGDVGGASFELRYNADYLKNPRLEWMPSVNSALNQVNTEVPGVVRATFALPALPVPAGTETLAVVSFRARSVPSNLDSTLPLNLLDISRPTGDPIAESSATRSGTATILVRRLTGDNNANQRLDVGDATLMQRLLTGLEPVRPWDTTGNDINQNTQLDSGDVIRVLRAAVGLDPQPTPQSAGTGGTTRPLSRHNLEPMSEAFGGALLLEADPLRAAPGETVTVRVRLDDVPTSLSAVALRLEYPVEALRLVDAQSHRVGALVPATAVAVWNVAPAQNDYAAQSGTVSLALSSALPWPASEGVLAEFSFQVQEGQSGRHQWPIRVSQAELSADGYDMTSIPDTTLYHVGRDPLPPQLTPAAAGLTAEGFAFSFLGETGLEYTVEVSTDLVEWLPLASQAGADETITVVDPAALGSEHRFYRVRFE